MEHTPGPWKHMTDHNVVMSKDGIGVCDCRTVDTTKIEAAANARLIAAAPDLLAACKRAMDELMAIAEIVKDGDAGEVVGSYDEIDILTAAIQKAEGGAA